MSDGRIGDGSKPRTAPAWFRWGGNELKLDVSPQSISYTYDMNTHAEDTKGGRVIQVLSSSIGTITLSGVVVPEWRKAEKDEKPVDSIRSGFRSRYQTMKEIESKFRSMMQYQSQLRKDPNGNEMVRGVPIDFGFAVEGMSGQVWVKSFGDVKYSVQDDLVTYSVTMEAAGGFSALKEIASEDGMARLTDVNWRRDRYHMNELSDGKTIEEWLKNMFERGGYGATAATAAADAAAAGVAGGGVTATGKGEFPKYTGITDDVAKKIARVCKREQGSEKVNVAACCSHACNLYEKSHNTYTAEAFLSWFGPSGWYGGRNTATMNSGSEVSAELVAVVKAIMAEGKRTLPRYVDEFDCYNPPDITSISTGTPTNRSDYRTHETVVKNKYDSTYTFYCFPDGVNGHADPFGYTSKEARQKYGDDCYAVS